jgi:histidine triad (HIT) family protein
MLTDRAILVGMNTTPTSDPTPAEPTIFTKIIRGDIPSFKIYEDDTTYAFLDIHPIQPGQVLVVPKNPIEYVWDLPPDEYATLMATAHKIALQLRSAFPQQSHVAMLIEGLEVAHAHLKLFPFSTDAEFRHVPDATAEPDYAALESIANKLVL